MTPKKTPERQCIGCGRRAPKRELIRVVRTPGGEVHVDRTGRANGRGAYLCDDVSCLEKAIRRHSLARALKCEVPGEVSEALRREMEDGHAG